MAKTKAELEQEINELHEKLCTAKGEMEDACRIAAKDMSAKELYEQYESFIKAGFSEEQAWTLIHTIVSNMKV